LHQASWWWWWWWWSTRRVEEAEEIAPYERSWHDYGFGLHGTWLLHRMMATILKRQWGVIVQYFLLVLLSQMEWRSEDNCMLYERKQAQATWPNPKGYSTISQSVKRLHNTGDQERTIRRRDTTKLTHGCHDWSASYTSQETNGE
jgi:hypothetical protein